MTNNNLFPLIINPTSNACSAIIWMHGLGADANDFIDIVPLLPVEKNHTRMIFPNAPKRSVTINMGMIIPAWYDISDLELRNADKNGILESTNIINKLIDEQIEKGISPNKIIIAGFSQGGAMALHVGLRYPKKLAGILALSCYVLERDQHCHQVSELNRDTPIWMGHGVDDNVVSYKLGKGSADFLADKDHYVSFNEYSMRHEISIPEIMDLSKWISKVLG